MNLQNNKYSIYCHDHSSPVIYLYLDTSHDIIPTDQKPDPDGLLSKSRLVPLTILHLLVKELARLLIPFVNLKAIKVHCLVVRACAVHLGGYMLGLGGLIGRSLPASPARHRVRSRPDGSVRDGRTSPERHPLGDSATDPRQHTPAAGLLGGRERLLGRRGLGGRTARSWRWRGRRRLASRRRGSPLGAEQSAAPSAASSTSSS
mmetsp:Transcript_10842/g.25211  ORF Transcript_10842/g.25211 Transcript_10842/m.25211 type:complete len:204 (+) Transcript_10842:551-1162(+)